MQPETYITDLLYRYECVIVPGLGAFLTHHKGAVLDTSTNQFYPPCKRVSFNQQLQSNDGLLANHIANAEGCDYTRALELLRGYAKNTKAALHNGKDVFLKNIGTLSLNKQGNVVFEPDTTLNFNTAAFGLGAFVSVAVQRNLTKEKEEHQLPSNKKTVLPYIKYAAVGLVVLGLSGFGGVYFFDKEVEAHNLAEKQKADATLESQMQQATFVLENPLPSLTLAVKKEYGRYHVVAGAYRLEENAEKKLAQLQASGYAARNIGANKFGLHQVVYDSFETRGEALTQLHQIKQRENTDAWLLIQAVD